MKQNPVYLWTLPMFHCNGWCFPWAVAAQGGTNVCLRRLDPAVAVDLIEAHGVSHMCGAPVVYSMLIDELTRRGRMLPHSVAGMVAGAAPPSALFERGERIGLEFTHVYGLTEVYGPAAVCVKKPEWAAAPLAERARLNARQGVAMIAQEAMAVLDPGTMLPVPGDGTTVGEIMFRGNATMTGYFRNVEATDRAFAGGWFHTGDLAVVDADGYARITDRSKDVIISGGENISSIEVEDVLHQHPAVSLAAVVAMADEHWGRCPAPLSSFALAKWRTRTTCAISAASVLQATRSRNASSSKPYPRPRQARCRKRRCATGSGPRVDTDRARRAACQPSRSIIQGWSHVQLVTSIMRRDG